jgi:uncharacterized protein (TIGR04255 family)
VEQRYRREELGHPPLVEALFELRVDSPVPYALVPGHLHSALGDDFETVRAVAPTILIDVVPPPPLVFHRFESRDKKRLIQCGPSVLTVNVLDDYGAFEAFETYIGFAMDKYFRVARPTRVTRLGLRYINLIDDGLFGAGWPYAVTIDVPAQLKADVVQRNMRVAYHDTHSDGTLAVGIAQPAQLANGRQGSLLDLDCSTEEPPQDPAHVIAWARRAHDSIYQVFRAYIEPVYGRLKERG